MADDRGFDASAVTVAPGLLDRSGVDGADAEEAEFEVIGKLGAGGMGEVLAARDTRLLRTVALKRLNARGMIDDEARQRFCIEAQVGAQLEHPNIVPIYGMEEDADGGLAFSMRLIEGKTFRKYLSKCRAAEDAGRAASGRYSLKTRLTHIAAICDALHYAHDRGVVHRDIKPGNVLLGTHGELYVVDWGIARVTSAPEFEGRGTLSAALLAGRDHVAVSDSGLTTTGSVLGTPRYMAPEQAAGEIEHQGPATDQFLVGMLLHEAVSLKHPRSGTNKRVFEMAIAGTCVPLTRYGGGPIDRRLVAIIDKTTAHDPDQRYENIQDLADDLRRFVRDEEVSVCPDTSLRRVWRRLGTRPELVLGVSLVLTMLIMTALAWSLVRTVDTERQAALDTAARTRLTTLVMQRGDAIEATLSRTRRVLARVVAVAQQSVEHPRESDYRWFTHQQLAAGEGPTMRFDERYGQPVTWDEPSVTYSYGQDPTTGAARARTLERLGPVLREAMLRARDVDGPTRSRAAQDALLREPGTLAYAAVGFTEGTLVNMPGVVSFPERYDIRGRPWYVQGVQSNELTWMAPYPDAISGRYLVPCYGAIRDAEGRVVGAAGGDMRMDAMIALLDMSDVPGFRIGRIINRGGLVIVDSREGGVFDDRAVEGQMEAARANAPLEDDVLREAIRRGDDGGLLERGDALVVFDHFTEIDWTLAVWVDTAAYLAGPTTGSASSSP